MAKPRGREGDTRAAISLILSRYPKMRQTEIAKRLNLSPATVCTHIKNIEDTPEHAVAMDLLRNTIPDASLIVALENKRILDKVLAGEGLTADEIKVVQGALKGGRVYQERSQVDDSQDVNTLLDKLLQSIAQLPHDQQLQLIERYTVMIGTPADAHAYNVGAAETGEKPGEKLGETGAKLPQAAAKLGKLGEKPGETAGGEDDDD